MKEKRNNRLPFMATDNETLAIDRWRYANHIATRAEAIRFLIDKGLAAESVKNGDGVASLATETPSPKITLPLERQNDINPG